MSAIDSVPAALPEVVGANVTLMLQDPPGATAALQELVSAKGAAAVTDVTVKDAVPPFVTVTVCATLVVPTVWPLKLSAAGAKVTVGWASPVPVSNTTWGLPAAVSVMVKAPTLEPATEGV